MKKSFKIILSVFIALAMILGAIPVTGFIMDVSSEIVGSQLMASAVSTPVSVTTSTSPEKIDFFFDCNADTYINGVKTNEFLLDVTIETDSIIPQNEVVYVDIVITLPDSLSFDNDEQIKTVSDTGLTSDEKKCTIPFDINVSNPMGLKDSEIMIDVYCNSELVGGTSVPILYSYTETVSAYFMHTDGTYLNYKTSKNTDANGNIIGFTYDHTDANGDAYYSRNIYTLTLEVDGEKSTYTCYYGSQIDVIYWENPSKVGYTFGYWVDENGDLPPDNMPAYDLTLTASWFADMYTMQYNMNGGLPVEGYTYKVAFGDEVPYPPDDPVRAGCAFVGWYPGVPETMPNCDITVTAMWAVLETYIVTYYTANGGVYCEYEVAFGDTIPMPPDAPTVTGFKFSKWIDADGNAYNFGTMPNHDLEFYPTYVENNAFEIESTFPKNGTEYNYEYPNFNLEITFSDEFSLGEGEIKICDYNTGAVIKTINAKDCYIDESNSRKLIININNQYNLHGAVNDTISFIPYETDLCVLIEKNAVIPNDTKLSFEGVSDKNIWHFTTGFGLNLNSDIFSFINAQSSKSLGGFNCTTYEMSYNLKKIILSKASEKEKTKINEYLDGKSWGGSCYGMAAVVALMKCGELDLQSWDINANSCFEMDYPKDSEHPFGVQDLINYYQLTQHRFDYVPQVTADRYFINSFLDTSFESVLSEIVRMAKDLKNTREPFIFSFAWEEKGIKLAHSCLAWGYSFSDNLHKIVLYDPSSNLINTLKISTDYENVELAGYNEIVYIAYTDVNNLLRFNIDKSIRTMSIDEAEEQKTRLSFVGEGQFVITNANGESLIYDNGKLSGDMPVYYVFVTDSTECSEIIVEVDSSSVFTLNNEYGESYFSVSQGGFYASADLSGPGTTVVSVDEGVKAVGDNLDFKFFMSGSDNMTSDSIKTQGNSCTYAELIYSNDTNAIIKTDSNNKIDVEFFDDINSKKSELIINDGVSEVTDPYHLEGLIKFSINTPSTRTINYGESIKLYANAVNLPDGYKIKWIVEGTGVKIEPSITGRICTVTSTSSGNVVIKAYVIDSRGKTITDENGKQICDSEYFYSEANLWLRIVYFFKKLFGISMNTVQLFKGVI